MEEYEVELIDYLRIIWKGKWVILACLVVALAVSAGVMWTRSPEYAETVSYHLKKGYIVQEFPAIDAQDIASLMEEIGPLSPGGKVQLKAEVGEDRIHVTLTGAVEETLLRDSLKRLASLVDGMLLDLVEERYSEAVTEIELQIEQMTHQRDLLQVQVVNELVEGYYGESEATRGIELQIEQMTRQRDLLQARMDAITTAEDPRLPYLAGKIIDLETSIVQQQVALETLDAKVRLLEEALQATEPDRNLILETARDIIPEESSLSYLLKEDNSLEAAITQRKFSLGRLKATQLNGLFILEEEKEPTVSRIGSNKKLNLAVAAVLGLLMGVLLAFFIHYLTAVKEREKSKTKD